MFISWLLAPLMGGCYLIHLGNRSPLRIWRMFLKPQTSWISRGLIFITLFMVLVAIQLALSYWFPGTIWEVIFKVVALGVVIPIAISVATYFMAGSSATLLIIVIAVGCEIVGGFSLRYCILKAGRYASLISTSAYQRV